MEDKKIKTSRASQTRHNIEVKKVWTPPNSLDAPPAPTGYRHQWIRAEILGQSDAKNVASSLREGWELVRADEYPDSQYPTDTSRQIRRDHWSGRPFAGKDTRGDCASNRCLL